MERPTNRKGIGGWIFLALVLMAYAVTASKNGEVARRALRFFDDVVWQVIPVLAIVFILLLVADLLIKPNWIRHNLGDKASARGWLYAVVGGVLATGPIYAWYAFLRELCDKGMHAPLAAVFLYSRAIKLPLLPLMIHYFGIAYTAILCLYLLVFSVIGGFVMGKLKLE